ncbi:MAG: hypothetical protein Q8P59_08895 [Dehalococcoidia bacterium]|nr:hypothetical protein [Dehalococcoidia bacterium]
MGIHRDVFELAAKLGCLEGYLYERPDAAPRYFPNWLGNIERMYGALPQEARADFHAKYHEVLTKVTEHLEKLSGPEDSNYLWAKRILAEAKG